MSTETETDPNETLEKAIKKKKPKNYINNADMMIEINLSRAQNKMTEKLSHMLMTLTTRYAKHPDYARIFSYEDDMKAFALLTLVKVWKGFNPEKSKNPFAYFTQIIRHAFYQYLNHEKKQREIKDEVLIDIGEKPSFTYMEKYSERDPEDGDASENAIKPDKFKAHGKYSVDTSPIADEVEEQDDLGYDSDEDQWD